MNRSAIALVFVLGCIGGGVAGRGIVPPAHAAPPAATRWEYDCGTNPSAQQLNAAGAQGWEMVAIAPATNGVLSVCFKRALP